MDSSVTLPSQKRLVLVTSAYLILYLILSIISGVAVALGVSLLRLVFQKTSFLSLQPSNDAFWLFAYIFNELAVILTAWICFRFSIQDIRFFQHLTLPKVKAIYFGVAGGIFLMGVSVLFSYWTKIIYGDLKDPIIERLLSFSPLYKIFFAILVSLIAPVCEEILFRRALFVVFRQYGYVKTGIIFSAFLFTLIHFTAFITMGAFYFAAIFIAGIILAIVYHKTNSIWTSIIAHILANTFSLLFYFYRLI